MIEAQFIGMERHQHRKNRMSVLTGGHTPCREAFAVTDAVDVIDDRNLGIAGQQEACIECGGRTSTVRTAATSACPITWPPKTRCQPTWGDRPRKRFTSRGSRSRILSRSWTAEDMGKARNRSKADANLLCCVGIYKESR